MAASAESVLQTATVSPPPHPLHIWHQELGHKACLGSQSHFLYKCKQFGTILSDEDISCVSGTSSPLVSKKPRSMMPSDQDLWVGPRSAEWAWLLCPSLDGLA